MNKLFLDIETIPAGEELTGPLKTLYQKRKAKHEERSEEEFVSFEKYFDATALDGSFGRIVCIGYTVNDGKVDALSGEEKNILESFWEIASNADMFIGHNIHDFDLAFILQRSTVLGVKPTWQLFEEPGIPKYKVSKFLDFARYKSAPIFDTMWEWTHWGDTRNKIGLEHVAIALGIPTPKEGIDGSKVNEFYKAGKVKEIVEYCKRDVETTRAVYKKMIFEGSKNLEVLPF